MEEKQTDLEFIKKILNNFPLLKWVRKYSADGLQEENKSSDFDIETDDKSISISDIGMVKMFFSSARYKGKTYATFDIAQIKECIALMNGKGRLIISDSPEKRLCYLQSEDNVVVIAPVTGEEEKPKPKKEKVREKESKEVEESKED